MEIFRLWFYNNFDWLYTKIHENPIFFIDYWSFVHLWSGFVLYTFILIYIQKKRQLIFFLILFSYEIFEIIIRFILFKIIEPETFKDQLTDILVGIIGGYIAIMIFAAVNKNSAKKLLKSFTIVFVSLTISFLWVGFYGYKYSVAYFNTNGLNLIAFFLWSFGSGCIIYAFLYVSKLIKKKFTVSFIVYMLYISCLFLFEYFSYHVLKVREISTAGGRALVFDIIHGNTILHIYYLIAPIVYIGTFFIFSNLFTKSLMKIKTPN